MQSGGLFRVNEKGVPGIFGCIECIPDDKKPDVDVETIVSIIDKENKTTH
jgi:hypothetical protein